jgi:hypothetical protein
MNRAPQRDCVAALKNLAVMYAMVFSASLLAVSRRSRLKYFLPVGLPANDAPGAQIKSCYSGN